MEPVKIRVIDHADTPDPVVATPPSSAPAKAKKVMITMHDELPAEGSTPPIDIFSDPKTAPAVPADLLKKLSASTKMADAPEPAADEQPVADDAPDTVVKTAPEPVAVPEPVVVAAEKPELPPAPPAVVNRVPQLIASTAPKLIVGTENAAETALSTADAAPEFITDNNPTPDDSTVKVPAAPLDDPKTEAAIAAIAASDSDELLAAQDAMRDQQADSPPAKTKSRAPRRRRWWLIPLLLLVLLVAVLAVPYSRYKVAGLVV